MKSDCCEGVREKSKDEFGRMKDELGRLGEGSSEIRP